MFYTATFEREQTIVPTEHEKAEWSRLATSAYASDRNSIGHWFSAAASLPKLGATTLARFDALQSVYRAWLIGGFEPSVERHEIVCITRLGFNFLHTEGVDLAAKVTYQSGADVLQELFIPR